MERLKSRKLWVTIVAGVLVTLGQQFGIELDTASLISLGLMVVAYVGGQSIVDRGKVVAEVQSKLPQMIAALNTLAQSVESNLDAGLAMIPDDD